MIQPKRNVAPMPTPNFQNRTLFKGDNLDFLRGINDKTVDLIATDPPFNKGKDFHATPESLAAGARFQDRWTWRDDVQPEWVDAIKDDHPRVYSLINHVVGGIDNAPKTRKRLGGSEDLAAFLCFMGVRLIEMRRILKDRGSLYLHCDPTASHYLKALMDAVFGARNFRNEIVWAYTGPGSPGMRQFNRKHDIILWYSKGKTWTFNADAVRIPHKSLSTNRAGRVIADALTPDMREQYLKKGKIPESWWPNFSPVGRIKTERVGLPHPKAPSPLRAHHQSLQQPRRHGVGSILRLRHHAHRRRAPRPPMDRNGLVGRRIRRRYAPYGRQPTSARQSRRADNLHPRRAYSHRRRRGRARHAPPAPVLYSRYRRSAPTRPRRSIPKDGNPMAERNFENRTLFHGDNLDFLRGMNSGTVDLIATDPPFNKDKDFHATPESRAAGARFQDRWRWNEDVQPEWVDAIKDDRPRVYSLIDYAIGGLRNNTNTRKKRGGAGRHRSVLVLYGGAPD